ncbi:MULTISPECIES: 6-phospho-3-hexuloisomerase [Alicyclobacillus]|uniref:6-phospho-3-hexuloisomerase n=1 Tax=Alicyclobacillus acidoterrestris (strain ATCC 49025 / DSM 3922 / CIP 106132 / NCIMB 13137 / GD3B) TaxID=1356854 RepID=T0DMW9_ALIAG|nr:MULTISPECIES: 6-phospho-3-hexuloisomerase [Alicyclobacillus]EPZ52702.1 hypothetical protein N007_02635 [Alicyclobacillus acidoterrestris ATCC 49025]UNO48897.1 6-phospho-3-hexuloisomerase [Alicyclobacillus acidoterrestris]
MQTVRTYTAEILAELSRTLDTLSESEVADFIQAIIGAGRVFVAGAGRSGFMMKGFAMRLMHLNIDAHVVGESVTPPFTSGDLLIIGSGSGETRSLVAMAEKATKLGGSVALITTTPDSTIGRLAKAVVQIHAQPKQGPSGGAAMTMQPMGSLFEQSLLLFGDAVVLRLMDQQHIAAAEMFARHANLE